MTDPTGVCFLSYRRARAAEGKLLIEALTDRGVPCWQDITDLPAALTESEIDATLRDAATASAVLLATPEVESSAVIREIEVPGIFRRVNQNDAFFAVPVAAGGLDYSDLPRILGPRTDLVDLTTFNVIKAPADPFDEAFASSVAKAVLKQRLLTIAKRSARGEPIRLQISTRTRLAKEPGYALRLDLRHRFDGRLARPGQWDSSILPAFDDVVDALHGHTSGRDVILDGFLGIPAAIALGAAFLSLAGKRVTWLQQQQDFSMQAEEWGLHVAQAESGFRATPTPRNASGQDLALLVSVNANVADDFQRVHKPDNLRAVVHVSRNESNDTRKRLGPAEARHVVEVAIAGLRQARDKYGCGGTVHLYLAVPVGIAFMIGQQLNTFGVVKTYEHMPGSDPVYVGAATLHPSH